MLSEDRRPKEYYGPSNVVSNWTKALSKHDINVSVRTIPINTTEGCIPYIINYLQSLPTIIKNLKNVCLDASSFDLVSLHYFKGIDYIIYSLMPKILRKPAVAHIYFPLKKRHLFLLNKNVHSFIAMNPYMANYLISKGIPRKKINMVFPPIDVDLFKKQDRKKLLEKYNIPPKKFILLYHGRPSTVRGLILFLHSIIFLKKKWNDLAVILSLANVKGEDLSLSSIKNFIRKFGLENIVYIVAGKNNPVEIYNLADIVVFPFMKKGAAICPPLSVLEAMACERVVVCSDIEELGIKYIIRNEYNGFLIKPTKEDLITCLESIRKMEVDKLKLIAKNARHTIQDEYSEEVVSSKFVKIVKNIC
jgi:glycosyltransferase involved in cell wall biosynthesis